MVDHRPLWSFPSAKPTRSWVCVLIESSHVCGWVDDKRRLCMVHAQCLIPKDWAQDRSSCRGDNGRTRSTTTPAHSRAGNKEQCNLSRLEKYMEWLKGVVCLRTRCQQQWTSFLDQTAEASRPRPTSTTAWQACCSALHRWAWRTPVSRRGDWFLSGKRRTGFGSKQLPLPEYLDCNAVV
jgi:hypothetical protein